MIDADVSNPSLESVEKELLTGFENEDFFNKSPLSKKIHALLELKDFKADVKWMAKVLDQPESTINTTLAVLEHMKVIKWKDGVLVDNFQNLITRPKTKAERIDRHNTCSLDILANITQDKLNITYNGYQAMDINKFWELNDKLCELQLWLHNGNSTATNTMLIGYSFSATNILSFQGEKDV